MNRTAKIKVSIITGFLGAGKTTFINQLLQNYSEIQFALVENEFGDVAIDIKLIKYFSKLTNNFLSATNLTDFKSYMLDHENILSKELNLTTVKDKLFKASCFKKPLKSIIFADLSTSTFSWTFRSEK